MDLVLLSETDGWLRYRAVIAPGVRRELAVEPGRRLNRRETEYRVTVGEGRPWIVVVLSMPNRMCAWRIADLHHLKAGDGDFHTSETLAVRDGALPYIVMQEPGGIGA